MTPADAVSQYIAKDRAKARAIRNYYKRTPKNFREAIYLATASVRPKYLTDPTSPPDKLVKESHQWRLSRRSLRRAGDVLARNSKALRGHRSFEALLAGIDKLLRGPTSKVSGIGELAVYDFADRIGAYLRVAPQFIYLHAGTRLGARRLGANIHGPRIKKSDLGAAFGDLTPGECENCLCIYFGKANGRRGKHRSVC